MSAMDGTTTAMISVVVIKGFRSGIRSRTVSCATSFLLASHIIFSDIICMACPMSLGFVDLLCRRQLADEQTGCESESARASLQRLLRCCEKNYAAASA